MAQNSDKPSEQLKELVVRAQSGDADAYTAIVQRFQDMALSYAYSILNDYDQAEDVRQESFIRAYCDLLSLRDPAAFPGWFRQIVLKHSLNYRRGKRALTVPLDEALDWMAARPGPDQLAEKRQIEEKVNAAISQLPPLEKQVTRLFYLESCSLREVSQQLDIPQKTIQSRLHSARARLKQHLMELAKDSVWIQHLSGNKQAESAAASEAVSHLDKKLSSLLNISSAEEQQKAADLILMKVGLLKLAGRFPEAIDACHSAMNLPALERDFRRQARLRTTIAIANLRMGNPVESRRYLAESLELLKQSDDPRNCVAQVLHTYGMSYMQEGNFLKARDYLDQAVREARKGGYKSTETNTIATMALVLWKEGRLAEALYQFRIVMRYCKIIGQADSQIFTHLNMAIIEENLGRYSQARRSYDTALQMATERRFDYIRAIILANLANLLLRQAKWRQALEYCEESAATLKKMGAQGHLGLALENAGLAYVGMKDYAEAQKRFDMARQVAQEIGDQERLVDVGLAEVECNLAQGIWDGELQKVTALGKTMQEIGYIFDIPHMLRLRAHLLFLEGKKATAQRTLEKAARLAQDHQNRPEEKQIRRLMSQLFTQRGYRKSKTYLA